jgi:CheY-like chemotaxis protein
MMILFSSLLVKDLSNHLNCKQNAYFSDGKDAIDFFYTKVNDTDKLPDIIFLDINMPVMNGWQF